MALPVMALAHHGTPITYDDTKTITVTGTVTQFFWGYPHVQIYLDRVGDKGQVEHWGVEMAPTPEMLRQLNVGWNRRTIKPGDMIVIVCHPHRVVGRTACLAMQVTDNGRLLKMGGAGRPAAAAAPSP